VRMHSYISRNTYWKRGVVLVSEDRRNRALVRADEEEGIISVAVAGPIEGRRDFLELIRADFRKIHSNPTRKGVQERVPLPDDPDVAVPYEHLRLLEEEGVHDFIPEGAARKYSVAALLDGVEDPGRRRAEVSGSRSRAEFREAAAETSKVSVRARAAIGSVWGVGLFWLLAFLVVGTAVVAVVERVPWYAVPVALITALLALSLIGILSAHQSGTLGEKGLVQSLKEFLGALPVLKPKRGSSDS
jgi:hypothetical protein